MNKLLAFVFTFLVILCEIDAQVPQKIIVEHFSNTLCPACSSRSPAFYEVYHKNPGIIHVGYYPSKPYRNCQLHQHNTIESDGRANYYSVISTPRFFIQGKLNNNYSKDDVYEPYKNKLSDVSIILDQHLDEAGQINVNVTLKNETGATLNNTSLYIGLAETYIRVEGNGVREKDNYDVFRKAFTPAEGEIVDLNETVNKSYKIDVHPKWDLEELFVYAIIQDTNAKTVLQAEATEPGIEKIVVGINDTYFETKSIYPNPASSFIYSKTKFDEITIYNNAGELVQKFSTGAENKFDVSNFGKGLYIIEAKKENKSYIQKLVKQ